MNYNKWVPDERGWIEHTGVGIPRGVGSRVEVLYGAERDMKKYTPMVVPSANLRWDYPKNKSGAIVAYLPVPHAPLLRPSRAARVRHLKRDSTYSVVLHKVKIQISTNLRDGDVIVVYKSDDDSEYYGRKIEEMGDGRFSVED